jgi:hypothetical protein
MSRRRCRARTTGLRNVSRPPATATWTLRVLRLTEPAKNMLSPRSYAAVRVEQERLAEEQLVVTQPHVEIRQGLQQCCDRDRMVRWTRHLKINMTRGYRRMGLPLLELT